MSDLFKRSAQLDLLDLRFTQPAAPEEVPVYRIVPLEVRSSGYTHEVQMLVAGEYLHVLLTIGEDRAQKAVDYFKARDAELEAETSTPPTA